MLLYSEQLPIHFNMYSVRAMLPLTIVVEIQGSAGRNILYWTSIVGPGLCVMKGSAADKCREFLFLVIIDRASLNSCFPRGMQFSILIALLHN